MSEIEDFYNLEDNKPKFKEPIKEVPNLELITLDLIKEFPIEQLDFIPPELEVTKKLTITKIDNNFELEWIPSEEIGDNKQEEESLCLYDHESCNSIQCNTSDYFLIENLFSELANEYQRSIARINLGISDENSLKWGNIKGNLVNQKDLYNFVQSSIDEKIIRLLDEFNIKFNNLVDGVNTELNKKANIYSPHFLGEPTTTLPLLSDNSGRIASTEWVTAKILATDNSKNIKYFKVSPEHLYYGQLNKTVTVSWDYNLAIQEQKINGKLLNLSDRSFEFTNVNDSFIITLEYKVDQNLYSQVYNFIMKYPIYYGNQNNHLNMELATSNKLTYVIPEGSYMFIYVPNGIDVEFSVNGLIGGFEFIDKIKLYNIDYYIYKTVNRSLGKITVTIL